MAGWREIYVNRLEHALAIGSACLVLVAGLPGPGGHTAEATPQNGVGSNLDRQLRQKLGSVWITSLDPGPTPSAEKTLLGQALFFDKVLGGNHDMACATCHHPSFTPGDALSLSIGLL